MYETEGLSCFSVEILLGSLWHHVARHAERKILFVPAIQ